MRRHGRTTLQVRYATAFAALAITLLTAGGAVAGWFAYRDALAAIESREGLQVRFVAADIAQFIARTRAALRGVVAKFDGDPGTDDLRLELASLVRHHPELDAVHWVAPDGRGLRVQSRTRLDRLDAARDWTADPAWQATRTQPQGIGPVAYRSDSEPTLTLAVAARPGGHALVAELDLKPVSDVIGRTATGSGVTYVIDGAGNLVAHVDIGLVLARTDVARLPQVRRALAADAPESSGDGLDLHGARVVSMAARVPGLGWTVLAEQPLARAMQPVWAVLWRAGVLVIAGTALALVASVVFARRLVRPIRAIEAAARDLAAGGDGHIEVDAGAGELQSLAGQFNHMAASVRRSQAELEQRIAERTQQLQQANEAKTRFLAAASHDLRQPMHALALFAGQLRELPLAGEARTLAGGIDRSAQAMESLLDNLLDQSQLDSGTLPVHRQPFALHELLQRLVQQFGASAAARGLALRTARGRAWVHSDPVLVERIVINLLTNALRYTERGRIVLGARRRGEQVELLVADTGIGIAAEQLPRVFDEFHRGPLAGGTRGLGLGLSIVRRLAEVLQHPVTIASHPGQGTCVRLRLPQVGEPTTAAPIGLPPDTLRGRRLLVVDDDEAARSALAATLAAWGCEVYGAADTDAALARVRQERPEAVLCDLMLADDRSGVELATRLDAGEGGGARPAVVFVTGGAAPDVIDEARAKGRHVLFKPVRPAKLRALLERVLEAGAG